MHTIRDGGWVRIRTGKNPYTYTYEAHGSASTMYGYVFRTHCIRLWPSLSISHRTTYMPLPIYVLAAHTARVTQWIHVVCGCCLAASSNTRIAATSLHACTHKHTHTLLFESWEVMCQTLAFAVRWATHKYASFNSQNVLLLNGVRTHTCLCVCVLDRNVCVCVRECCVSPHRVATTIVSRTVVRKKGIEIGVGCFNTTSPLSRKVATTTPTQSIR